jgi:hypothetical protein
MLRKTRAASAVYYPSVGKGEDSRYLSDLKAAVGKGAVWDNTPDVYFRLYHGGNTWSATHFGLEGVLPNIWCQRVRAASNVRKGKVPCSAIGWQIHPTVMELYKPLGTNVMRIVTSSKVQPR